MHNRKVNLDSSIWLFGILRILITMRPYLTGMWSGAVSARLFADFLEDLASERDWESLSDVRHSRREAQNGFCYTDGRVALGSITFLG